MHFGQDSFSNFSLINLYKETFHPVTFKLMVPFSSLHKLGSKYIGSSVAGGYLVEGQDMNQQNLVSCTIPPKFPVGG